MALFDFLRKSDSAPVESIQAIPVVAKKLEATAEASRESYVFYAFLFDESPAHALHRLKKELRAEGLEFLEIAGRAESVPLNLWTRWVEQHLNWIQDTLPSAAQLESGPRGLVYYSPKIVQR